MPCDGSGDAKGRHCCFIEGERCQFSEDNVGGRRYSCSLRRELGNWDAVHSDPRYIENVQVVWDRLDARPGVTPIVNCGTWGPSTKQCCYREDP